MTGNVLIDLAISAGGVAILVGIAWAVFGARSSPVDIERTAERLAFDEPDFAPTEWLINDAGDAALARNDRGETALVFVHGDGLVTRRFAAGELPARHENDQLSVERADHTSREASFAVAADKVALWLEPTGLK